MVPSFSCLTGFGQLRIGLVVGVALACCVLLRAQPETGAAAWPGARAGATLSAEDDAFLAEMERAAFRFFVEQTDPHTGLVRDRARADGSPSEGKASIAASGFALTAWAVATQRGWVERAVAVERVRLMLQFLAHEAPRRHGFYYHFMEMDTGTRAWQCELSSIDTGLFLAGAIVAREYFHDAEITDLVNRIYGDIDWQWFLNGGSTVAMGWYDETGFSRFRWLVYSEHMMMSFLALGAPAHALSPEYWRTWKRAPIGSYGGYHYIEGPPLFIHQYAHAFIDFRGRRDAFADYYHNSLLATLAQRKFCSDLRSEFPSWGERLWGLTASDSATGYKAWGGPPRTMEFNALDGTIVPCAAAGSLPFAPYETMMVLRHIRTVFSDRTWQRYGFVDAFNPETGWVDSDVVGVDLGISLVQAENARSGLVWAVFMQAPEVQRALRQGGFLSYRRTLTWSERDQLRGLAAQAWHSLASAPVAPASAGLQLTATPAAHALGLLNGGEALQRARALLEATAAPAGDVPLAQYAAGLVTLRQAFHSLAPAATRGLEAIKWDNVTLSSTKLAAGSRLAAFFKIALGVAPPALWTKLVRTPEAEGPVYVLSPVSVADQFLPGLWLDERAIISGASAAQLAYALTLAHRDAAPAVPWPDALTTALLLDQFPAEVVAWLKDTPPPAGWLDSAPSADRAALLLSIANLLVPDCVRQWFQQDPLVQAARANIPEFEQAAFGKDSSVFWCQELAGPLSEPPERRTAAVAATAPRANWPWVKLSGLEFKDSPGDVRPDDPALELRFAFTWDNQALHFHAEAMDTPPGFTRPPDRKEFVELFMDPQNDGLVWRGPDDFQFVFKSTGESWEWCRNRPAAAQIHRTEHGYTVEADIPWSLLGLTPHAGLEFGVSPAVATDGSHEWEPSLKLNWRFFQRRDERFGLGTLRLE
ncbi:MAG TPA: glucoamylase family protein [Opitutaceae bacterium]|nr:glucoamylase family protein [Opitutaceae bacterium]